jgi:hypothetical protein
MDTRSETTLEQVYPALRALIEAGAAVCEAQGIYLCVFQGLRSAAYQNNLYALGRTLPDHEGNCPGIHATNAKAGQSMHNYGLAVDVVPYLDGQGGNLNWESSTPEFQAMITALKAEGLVYGGDWVHFRADDDHFQMPGIPPSPDAEMIADYTSGLSTVWTNVGAGKYA